MFLVVAFLLGFQSQANASCVILQSSGQATVRKSDPLAINLSAADSCPTNVNELRALLQKNNLRLQPTMVANRGFHNPQEGSFSFFEMVSNEATVPLGDFFFGHFTGLNEQNEIDLEQAPRKGALMIEAIARDAVTEVYNFYELIGNGQKGQWFYRGDSTDILSDNEFLHLQKNPANPQFGKTLRCSGCHLEGGPIMKELASPHNDWWSVQRGLNFGGRSLSQSAANIAKDLVGADDLAKATANGVQRLLKSQPYQQALAKRSFQELLRPLFCPMEINFESDVLSRFANKSEIRIPSAFFLDAFWGDSQFAMVREVYEKALTAVDSRFPENGDTDADHAWLTPVRATSDQLATVQLIQNGWIDSKFMEDVLMVDFQNPTLSNARCSLLRFVPKKFSSNWRAELIKDLQNHVETNTATEAVKTFYLNLTEPQRTSEFYRQKRTEYIHACQEKLKDPESAVAFVSLLNQRRKDVRNSEISKNPRGQILEPGFRVIFPEMRVKEGVVLSEKCELSTQ